MSRYTRNRKLQNGFSLQQYSCCRSADYISNMKLQNYFTTRKGMHGYHRKKLFDDPICVHGNTVQVVPRCIS